MIARVWRCTATTDGARQYVEYFNRSVRKHVEGIDGFRNVRILSRKDGEQVEILVITEWDALDAVRKFAGADIDRAVVEPEALALLLIADTRVRNFDIV